MLVAVAALAGDLWLKGYSWDKLVQDVAFYDGVAALSRRNLTGDPLSPQYDVVLVPHALELTAVANQGAAMGLGQGHRTLFLIVSVAAIEALFYFFRLQRPAAGFIRSCWGCCWRGLLGNLYDRLAFGYVRDMLHLFPGVRWSDPDRAAASRRAVPVGLQPSPTSTCASACRRCCSTACSPTRAPPTRPPTPPPTPPRPPRSRRERRRHRPSTSCAARWT